MDPASQRSSLRAAHLRPLAAEALGTFALVLIGTGAIVVDAESGALGHVGVSLVFGLVVLALVQAFGDASGAHLNPAVTSAFVAAGRFPLRALPGYVLAQLSGAALASLLVRTAFPLDATLGATLPRAGIASAFVCEVVLTWFLMLVVLSVSHGAKERGMFAALTIGAVVALEALVGGPLSGASMNPARSFGPALVSGRLDDLWLYALAPLTGALLAVPTCRLVRAPGCCGAPSECS